MASQSLHLKDASNPTRYRKAHFDVLDGLRGTASVLVVMSHLMGVRFALENPANNFLRHAYLAVDFFYCLSGFVVSYAYDERWGGMGVGQFFKLRLLRLHPMVVLGVVVGLICYVGDPFLRRSHEPAVTLEALALSVVAGLLLLPSPSLPGRFTATHSLNDPHWTLLQEYLANIAYALILRRLSTRKLASVVAFSAGVLGVTALRMDGLLIGNKFETIWGAPIRMVFPFLCGMLLYRLRRRVALPQVGFVWLSLVLMLAFAVPVLTKRGGVSLNGAYDLACVTLLFPGIILAGAHSSPGRFVTTFCRSAGRLAYPLYAVHFPLLWVYIGFVIYNPPRPRLTSIVGWILAPTLLLIGWLAVIWWDEPVRRWLKRKYA